MNAVAQPAQTNYPADALDVALEAICRAYGFRAAHIAAHAALKRVAEARRAELTAQGWVI